MERKSEIKRKTFETDVSIKLNLDGTGVSKLDYPLGFMAHMLAAFAKHGLFDLELKASGDLHVDDHHLVEDSGIVLGQCFAQALGDKRGVYRSGSCLFPMDEALVRAAVDLSGRPYCDISFPASGPQSLSENTVVDFWQGFASHAALTLHIDVLKGRSSHHIIEAMFKAAAKALRQACEIDLRAAGAIPSTKGVLVC